MGNFLSQHVVYHINEWATTIETQVATATAAYADAYTTADTAADTAAYTDAIPGTDASTTGTAGIDAAAIDVSAVKAIHTARSGRPDRLDTNDQDPCVGSELHGLATHSVGHLVENDGANPFTARR